MPPESAKQSAAMSDASAMENFGSWVADVGLDQIDESRDAAAPLPTDAHATDASEVEAGEQKDTASIEAEDAADKTTPAENAGKKQGEAKETAQAEGHDPDLSPEENALVESRPEAERGETANKLKAAKFEDHYTNPDKPAEEVRSYLEHRSPSRYGELETAILDKQLADPDAFAVSVFNKSPESYGKLALAVFKADPAYFTKEITGRDDVDAQEVQTALDFYARNRDKLADMDAQSEIPSDVLEEMKQFFPDHADNLDALLNAARDARAGGDDKAQKPDALSTDAQGAKPAANDGAEQQAQLIQQERDQTWNDSYGHVENYLTQKVEKEYGLTVTPKERESAPLVARLKDIKRDILFRGMGEDLPDFERGLGEYGKPNAAFMENVNKMYYFSDKREKQNALAAAQSLVPFADKYLNERLKAPVFKELDNLIALAAREGSRPIHTEKALPGSLSSGSQPVANDPMARMDAFLRQDALQNG